MNKEYLKQVIDSLSQPVEYKWKVQSFTKDKSKALCVAYIDARIVIQRLNEVCEHGWHRSHFAIGNDTYCNLGIVMPDGTTIWRSDVGDSENATERAKTAASDSFKRAAVQFGLGLFLYDLDIVTLKAKEDGKFTNVVDDKGNKIWDITAHINGMKKGKPTKTESPNKEVPKKKELDWLNPGTENWAHVVKRMKEDKKVTIETIEKHFRISPDSKSKLLDETK